MCRHGGLFGVDNAPLDEKVQRPRLLCKIALRCLDSFAGSMGRSKDRPDLQLLLRTQLNSKGEPMIAKQTNRAGESTPSLDQVHLRETAVNGHSTPQWSAGTRTRRFSVRETRLALVC